MIYSKHLKEHSFINDFLQVLETAKLLKIKGLTEMPDSTSLTRSQGTSADFQSPGDSIDSQRHSSSPAASPSNKRRRFVCYSHLVNTIDIT